VKTFFQIDESSGVRGLTKRAGSQRFSSAVATCFSRTLWLARKTAFTLFVLSLASTCWAQKPVSDLTEKSIEDLMDIEVTSVSKKEEKLFQTAAAVYVITQEEIRRSGLTNVPELLRLAPGLEVARIDGTKWAISARGFNGRLANKLLVLVDGRSVYSPENSGVYWEVQNPMLEDVERIEVIRGPGGTLWGANAVNGVINIITKPAKETQGGLLTTGGGTQERGFGSVRYGAKIGDHTYYRVYGKYFNRLGLLDSSGHDADDGQQTLSAGGRLEWQLTSRDLLTFQGDIYRSNVRETSTNISPAAPFDPALNTFGEFAGGNVLGRWTHSFSGASDLALQVYYDRFTRDIFDLGERLNALDVDFQHHFAVGRRNDIVWGGGYRRLWDDSDSTSRTAVQYHPKGETRQVFSLFVHDDITLVKDRLRLMLGTKIEGGNEFGDKAPVPVEAQPTVRMLWTPSTRQTVWGAVSRAVRTPSQGDQDVRVNISAFPGPGGIPSIVALLGSADFKSESVLAYEFGYRAQLRKHLSVDLATFYNHYQRLQTIEPGIPFLEIDPQPAHLIIPLVFGNLMRGETYGGELSMNWNVANAWRLAGSYSFLRTQLHIDPESRDSLSQGAEGASPRHQLQLHSFLKLPRNLGLDASIYHVSRLSTLPVPSYTRLDVRFAWRLKENIEISAVGQNLLHDQHLESNNQVVGVVQRQVKRGVFGKVVWSF
jgi:iron complex outermembrane recepter protein